MQRKSKKERKKVNSKKKIEKVTNLILKLVTKDKRSLLLKIDRIPSSLTYLEFAHQTICPVTRVKIRILIVLWHFSFE